MEGRQAKVDERVEEQTENSSWELRSSLEYDSENEGTLDEDENQLTLPKDSYIPILKYYHWKVVVRVWCTTSECEHFLRPKTRVRDLKNFYLESEHGKMRCRCCGRAYRIKFYTENVNVCIYYKTSHGMKSEKHNFGLPNSFEFRLPADWVSCEAKFTRVRMSKKLQHAVERVFTHI
jgi:hypothetical protein